MGDDERRSIGEGIINQGLVDALRVAARDPHLLVASDFDGTLSELVGDPTTAVPVPDARAVLRRLSEIPSTTVAILSGRQRSDLELLFEGLSKFYLVGSHGRELSSEQRIELFPEESENLHRAIAILERCAAQFPGSFIERKPWGVCLHYRAAPSFPESAIEPLVRELESSWVVDAPKGVVRLGKCAVEFSVSDATKGSAMRVIVGQTTATATVFFGDDTTDESVFTELGARDVTIKVGDGHTAARYRVDNPEQVVAALRIILEERLRWATLSPGFRIEDSVFLSDLRTAAIVSGGGEVAWMCGPRVDSSPIFGSLVAGPQGGYFRVSIGEPKSHRYIGNSLISLLESDSLTLRDFLVCSPERAIQRAGRSELIRIIEGEGIVEVEFAPKFNFGRVPTRLVLIEDGIRVECGAIPLVLQSPGWEWRIESVGVHDVGFARRELNRESVALRLIVGTASVVSGIAPMSRSLGDTVSFWEGWVSGLAVSKELPEPVRESVVRSAVCLRGLVYGPTGAIAAAPTTSLPESLGEGRNWDYRFCWLRDGAMTAGALHRLGDSMTAMRFLDWVCTVVFDTESDRFIAPLYTVTGRTVPGEAEISEALGYQGSRPVRIGNLAADQLQLDTLGPVAVLLRDLSRSGAALTSEHLLLVERMVHLIESRWMVPDSGIWEMRGPSRHYVHSKVMCWHTVACCIEVARYFGFERSEWSVLLKRIRDDVEEHGFSEKVGSYTIAYDLEEPDAALLWIILSEFHSPEDPMGWSRATGTVRWVMSRLLRGGAMYRYLLDDSLRGVEGEFIICRSWLVEALILIDERDMALDLFNVMLSRVSGVGLMSEAYDVNTGQALGNYPQGYSHLGLINAALALFARNP